jgi:hypothetical protein
VSVITGVVRKEAEAHKRLRLLFLCGGRDVRWQRRAVAETCGGRDVRWQRRAEAEACGGRGMGVRGAGWGGGGGRPRLRGLKTGGRTTRFTVCRPPFRERRAPLLMKVGSE